jgi:hypothetical protein
MTALISSSVMWFFLTEQQAHSHWHHCCCSHHSRWQWEHHCCIQNSECMVTSLAVTATLTEMFWCTMTFQKSVILCVWQLIQLAEINTLWLWIRIALMYNSDEFSSDSMWCIAVQTEHSHWAARMTLVWEKWVYWVSCCWSTKRTESTSTATREEQQHMHCKEWGPCELSALRHIPVTLTLLLLLLMLLLLSLLYESQCWHIQSRKVSHTKVVSEEVEEERKESCMWGEGL